VEFSSFPEKNFKNWEAVKNLSITQKETIKKNLVEKSFEEKYTVICKYRKALETDKVYFKLGEDELYKKVLTKWMSLSTVKFYASLKQNVVNIPFSITAHY
jgi:hypothetical protein